MEKRLYQREKVNLNGLFYIVGAAFGQNEFSGTVINISECGIAVRISDARYMSLVDESPIGTDIKFLFIDEYELFHEKKKVFVEGHARIVRKEPGTQSLIIGCEVYGRREALEQYVADRKLIPFVKDEIRFLHDDK